MFAPECVSIRISHAKGIGHLVFGTQQVGFFQSLSAKYIVSNQLGLLCWKAKEDKQEDS